MKYNIVTDSACELTQELETATKRTMIPFFIDIGEKRYVDDGTIDLPELRKAMKDYDGVPKTAAPTPYDFLKAFEKGTETFAVTISSALSATYSNAILAKQMAEEQGNKLIHVFDSRSAVCGETAVVQKLKEFIDQGMEFQDIVNKVEEFITTRRTLFVLESLDNLMKNGRMSKVAGFIANVLSIKPVLTADKNGEIKLVEKTRGLKKAHTRMIEIIGEDKELLKDRVLFITHCNAAKAAEEIKEQIIKMYQPKDVQVLETGGLSTIYADNGGIVISY